MDSQDPNIMPTHATPVADAAWDLYAFAVRRFGPKPTLIEWDNEIPPLGTLVDQAARADSIAAANTLPEVSRAVAR
jgi:uncharacterized protein (UPF0276 family)